LYTLPVEHERWRTRDTNLLGDAGLVLDHLGVLTRVKTGVEGLGVQSQGSGKSFQIVLAKGSLVLTILVGEKIIMILPEGILISGALSSFSCPS
jgi:hypothetical protein